MINKFFLFGILFFFIYILNKKNIENFTLQFPNQTLKCKCDLDDDTLKDNNVDNNNIVENFTNYDKSEPEEIPKIDRIYNIYKSPYDQSAESYYTENYAYPIKPLDKIFKYESSNSHKYNNIGKNTDKLLSKYNNNNLISYNYNLGINYDINNQS